MRKVLGWVALCYPIVIWFFEVFTSVTARWHFSEHFRLYDLLSDSVSMAIFCVGLALLLQPQDRSKALAAVAVVFVGLQTWAWMSAPERALASLELPSGVVAVQAVERAEYSIQGAVDVVYYRPYWGLFIEPVAVLAQVDEVYEASLHTSGPAQVRLEMEMMDHQQKHIELELP